LSLKNAGQLVFSFAKGTMGTDGEGCPIPVFSSTGTKNLPKLALLTLGWAPWDFVSTCLLEDFGRDAREEIPPLLHF
jgi:hypothetical protein